MPAAQKVTLPFYKIAVPCGLHGTMAEQCRDFDSLLLLGASQQKHATLLEMAGRGTAERALCRAPNSLVLALLALMC